MDTSIKILTHLVSAPTKEPLARRGHLVTLGRRRFPGSPVECVRSPSVMALRKLPLSLMTACGQTPIRSAVGTSPGHC